LFLPARWKAYLQNLQDNDTGDDGDGRPKSIYQIYHSQLLWFTRDYVNVHNKTAGEHLERADALLDDCSMKVDALEETLANTPKPSEVLDWNNLW
jgi:hypothetical protein